MNKLIIGNFKMNKSMEECNEYVNIFQNYGIPEKRIVVLCPPYFALNNYVKLINNKSNCFVGAQNCSSEKNGSFTGEVSCEMIKSTGARYVIIGHSERRIKLGETDEIVNEKVKRAIESGLVPIICVGEKLDEISKKKSVLSKQLSISLKNIDISKIIIAYEPVWAIGTGKTCSLGDIESTHSYIKEKVIKIAGIAPLVVYGGSVKSSNASEILKLDAVDGVLVGGASLDPRSMYSIITS